MNYDNILANICFGKRIRIKQINKIEIKCPNIQSYLMNRFEYVESIKESLHRIKNNIEIRPICPICGKKVKYRGLLNKMYNSHCSVSCSMLDPKVQTKTKQTCLEKYGVEYSGQSKQKKEKSIKTWIMKYGVDNPRKAKFVKEKIYKYFQNKNRIKTIIQKRKQTCLEKYGVEYSSQDENIKNKTKQTCLEKYGVEYSWQNENVKNKIKKTCLEKYGVEHFNNLQKRKQTCLEKYGVSSWSKTKDFKEMMLQNKEIIENKRNDTKRRNHTFNTSKPEEELYLYIKRKFPNVKRQYIDKDRYPYNCDFYIPELDLFLELNGIWTHGKHPYISTSKEDNLILRQWTEKSKEHPFYLNAINTWTIKDVKKRECASKYNLNFKEVWTLDEGKDFINSL